MATEENEKADDLRVPKPTNNPEGPLLPPRMQRERRGPGV